MSAYAPVTSRAIEATVYNLATAGLVYIDTGEHAATGGVGWFALNAATVNTARLLIDSSQSLRYGYNISPTGSNFFFLDVVAYEITR